MVELATKFSLPPERRFRASPRCESIGDSRQGALTRRSPLPRLFTSAAFTVTDTCWRVCSINWRRSLTSRCGAATDDFSRVRVLEVFCFFLAMTVLQPTEFCVSVPCLNLNCCDSAATIRINSLAS